jgi:hypothetical protein
MKRYKVRTLDYFVDGRLLIPMLFLELKDQFDLMDAAYDDNSPVSFKTVQRKKGA